MEKRRELAQNLFQALGQAIGYQTENWKQIVDVVSKIADYNDSPEGKKNPVDVQDINLERSIDDLAQKTAWIYERLGNEKRAKDIKKALGYNVK